jgi:DNA topoisomerase-1
MSLDTITLEDALTLLELPRVVGVDPESGDEITAQNGRYGPYLKKGTDSRSIDSEEKLLTITLEEALAIYAQPKQRGRAAANPGKEVGKDPVSGNMVLMKSGRFGTYVTDGEYNATLRQGDDEATLTIERAAELLEERRAKGPAKKTAKKTAKKSAPKKSAAKKTPAKKTAAAKTTTKKTTAKKTTTRKATATKS